MQAGNEGLFLGSWVSTSKQCESLCDPFYQNPPVQLPKSPMACIYFCLFVCGVLSCSVTSKAPLSMEFSRQEYWSGLPCPPPGNLPKHRDWTQVSHIAGRFFTIWATREALVIYIIDIIYRYKSLYIYIYR